MSAYDLTKVELPKLQGMALRAFAKALEAPGVGTAAVKKLAKDAGIDRLAAADIDDAPRPNPLVPVRLGVTEADEPADLSGAESLESPGPFVSAKALTDAYREGKTDPVTIAERALEAVKAAGDRLGTMFIEQNADHVMHQAKASKERWDAGKPLGPLDGVPVGVKDEMDVAGYPTTVGTTFLGAGPAIENATIVGRMRDAGAVILGKLNMHEIGINPNGANPHHGLVRNPYDPKHDTGGSSSGSAACVAAGYAPITLGADGGGSIRIPAAHCGVVGLKATFGRISEHGVQPLCWTVGHVGPLGATVRDVAIAYGCIAGADPGDPSSLVQPKVTVDDLSASVKGTKVGVFRPWFEHATPAIVKRADEALAHLTEAGAEIVEIVVPQLDLIRIAHAVTILSEMATAMEAHRDYFSAFAPHVRVNLAVGRTFHSMDYVRAQRMRARGMASFDRIFEEVDVIATPTTAVTACEIPVDADKEAWSDLSTVTEYMRFIFPQNLLGHPAISVPAGFDDKGLPVGLQLTGRHWDEQRLLRLAYAVEAKVERHVAPDYTRLLPDA